MSFLVFISIVDLFDDRLLVFPSYLCFPLERGKLSHWEKLAAN